MATLTIRQIDEKTKLKLRVRAAYHGRSMEEEAREILRSSLAMPEVPKEGLASMARRYFGPRNGVDLELPEREPIREPPDFSE